jgi:hypothetical protein
MAWFEVQGISLISGLSTWKTELSKVRSVSGVMRHPLCICTYVHCNTKLTHLCFVSGIEGQLHVINILCWAKSIHVQWFWRVCGKEEMSWAYILGWGIQYNFVVSYWTEYISRRKDCRHPPVTRWRYWISWSNTWHPFCVWKSQVQIWVHRPAILTEVFIVFFLFPDKCWDSILEQAMTTSLHKFSDSFQH